MKLSTAFKRQAEGLGQEIRQELGLSNLERLPAADLLRHLGLPMISLSQLGNGEDALRDAVDYLRSEDASSLSAMTVFRGHRRAVVFNDAHDDGRQASDLCHEAAHAVLMHTPAAATDSLGCRIWDQEVEDEAGWLGGALLIPGKAARYAAKAGWTFQYMATRFGCSEQMARWRNNESGGQRLR